MVQRAVTLRVVTPKDGVAQDKVNPKDKNQLSLTADTKNMTADEIAALHLDYAAVNTAGNEVTLAPNIAPSNYTVSPCKTTATNETLYNNYEFTFIPGVYTVNGLTYILTLKAEDFGEGANKHSVGSASIITAGLNAGKADDGSAFSSFTANTDVTLTAVPVQVMQSITGPMTAKKSRTARRRARLPSRPLQNRHLFWFTSRPPIPN